MNKEEYLKKLSSELYFMSYDEKEEILKEYDSIIEDSIRDGMKEIDVLKKLGSPIKLAKYIKDNREFKFKMPKKKNKILAGLLILFSSPLWGALLILIIALVLGIIIIIWSVPVTTVFLFLSAVFAGGYSVLGSFIIMASDMAEGLMQFGVGMMFIGVAVLLLVATVDITKFITKITVKVSKTAGSYIREKIIVEG